MKMKYLSKYKSYLYVFIVSLLGNLIWLAFWTIIYGLFLLTVWGSVNSGVKVNRYYPDPSSGFIIGFMIPTLISGLFGLLMFKSLKKGLIYLLITLATLFISMGIYKLLGY